MGHHLEDSGSQNCDPVALGAVVREVMLDFKLVDIMIITENHDQTKKKGS